MKKKIAGILIILWCVITAIFAIPLWAIERVGSMLEYIGKKLQYPFHWLAFYVAIVNQKLGVK